MTGVNLTEKRALDERRRHIDAGALRVLTTAGELVAAPEHWTQGTSARSADGRYTTPTDSGAACWCASGALLKAITDANVAAYRYAATREEAEYRLRFAILERWPAFSHMGATTVGLSMIAGWNDATDRTHAEVVATFGRACALLTEAAA